MEFQGDALLMLFTKSIVQLIPISVDHSYAMNHNVHFRILLKYVRTYLEKKCKSVDKAVKKIKRLNSNAR